MLGWSFASFRREIAEPVTADPKTTPWLHGMWKGVATIVRPIRRVTPAPEKTTHEMLFGWHSPADLFPKPALVSQYTMALAEISPPLFVGVRMVSASVASLRFGPPHPGPQVQLEPATLDRAFSTYAANGARLRSLFERRGPTDDFPEQLAAAAARTPIAIQDGVVEVFLPGKLFDPRVVGGELDAAVAIAKELSLRAAELPEDPKVAATKRAWADVAESRGLEFDPLLWHAFGRVDGTRIEVLLEPSDSFVRTTVRAAFRTPLDAVARTPALVEAFRRECTRAARVTKTVLVNDAEVLLAQERCVAPQELATLIDHAVAIVAAANPKAATPPYR